MIRVLVSLAVLGLLPLSASAEAIYYIGNSLTWDAGLSSRVEPYAGERGHEVTTGHHIRCNQSLDYIWNNPTDVCVSSPAPYGTHGNALPNFEWDVVTLQPFQDVLDGEAGAINRIGQFIEATEGSPQYYVYSAWMNGANSPSFDYSTRWDRDASVGGTFTRDWFEQLMTGLDGTDVLMIPIGDVLYEVDQRAKAGNLPGLNSARDLYRDDTHLNVTGQNIAAWTVVSTVWRESPMGLSTPQGMSPELALALQETVWDVVSTHSYTSIPEPSGAVMLVVAGAMLLRRRKHIRPYLSPFSPSP